MAGEGLYPARERGDDKADFPNWAMVAAERMVFDRDRLLLRAMLSLDPLTEGREGYPLLFQSGEGLVDRQHAHDLFMELAALYKHRFTASDQAFLYFGWPGEPTLGPAAFMHRPSAWNDPDAPLAHHSQDATHITYGVATLGWIHRAFKLDGSVFTGREPDDDRWDIEGARFDSYSLRATVNLGGNLTLQASGGYLKDTEPDESGVDIARATASIDHNLSLGADAFWASALIYGSNAYVHGPHRGMVHSAAAESNLETDRWAAWGRWESVERLGADLDIPAVENRFFWVHSLTAGAGATLVKWAGLELLLGAQGTFSAMDEDLEPYYGTRPLSWEVFLRLRPASNLMGGHGGHHAHGDMSM